jgi:hypothetical protein
MTVGAEKLKCFGFNVIKLSSGCGYCNSALRKQSLRCADLLCCDRCGRVWGHHGAEGLLREIGRREVSK